MVRSVDYALIVPNNLFYNYTKKHIFQNQNIIPDTLRNFKNLQKMFRCK